MATTTRHIDLPVHRMWELFSDADNYPRWVVGAKHLRAADEDWPAVGARFHHRLGVGLLTLADSTSVLECEPERLLVLQVRARPVGEAQVRLTLAPDPDGSGTVVTMQETPVKPAFLRAIRLLLEPLLHLRNTEALRRLERLAQKAG